MFKVKELCMDAGDLYIVVLNSKTLKKHALHPLDRIDIIKGKKRLTCIINSADKIVKENEIGVYLDVKEKLNLKNGDEVEIEYQEHPKSLEYIREKINGRDLNQKKIEEIIRDITIKDLTESEIAAFVTAMQINRIDMEENEYLSKAMVKNGRRLSWGKKKVFDKHSLGGIPGKKKRSSLFP